VLTAFTNASCSPLTLSSRFDSRRIIAVVERVAIDVPLLLPLGGLLELL
jgi:hypothetical protein